MLHSLPNIQNILPNRLSSRRNSFIMISLLKLIQFILQQQRQLNVFPWLLQVYGENVLDEVFWGEFLLLFLDLFQTLFVLFF